MLARIYGLYTIQSGFFANLDVILMENIAKNLDKSHKIYSFDLKGSVINRKDKNVVKGKILKC